MTATERTLVLVRHGQSYDNEQDLFSGLRDPDLTSQGVAEAIQAGRQLRKLGFCFDLAFTSELTRAQRTLTLMLAELGQSTLTVRQAGALNERDYGELAGLNKEEARGRWGVQQVRLWRKSNPKGTSDDEPEAGGYEKHPPDHSTSNAKGGYGAG